MKKVLILKRGAMGDILMATPFIRQLKTIHPDYNITFCVSESFKSVLCNNPYLDNLIAMSDQFFTSRGIASFIKFLLKIRKEYDYIFLLGKSTVYNLLVKCFTKSTVIGFARDFLSWITLDYAVTYDNVYKYQTIYYLELLKVFKNQNINYTDLQLDMYIDEDADVAFKENLYLSGDYIVFTNSGGNNQYEKTGLRMLPESLAINLIQKLLEKYTVILLGSKADYDNYQNYIQQIKHDKLFNCAGKFNLSQSALVIKNSTQFITTDCGAMHLGILIGNTFKMKCLFGATNYYHILPPGFNGKIIWNDFFMYDINYQLYGKSSLTNKNFFTQLDVYDI